jgi:hypothetical protein
VKVGSQVYVLRNLRRQKKDRGNVHKKRKTRTEMYTGKSKRKHRKGKYINCCFAKPHTFTIQQTIAQSNLSYFCLPYSCADKQALRWLQPPSQDYRLLRIRLHETNNANKRTLCVSLLMLQIKNRLGESLSTSLTLHITSTVWYSVLCFATKVSTAYQFPL